MDSSEIVEKATLLLSEITAERTASVDLDPRLTIDVRQTPHGNRWCVVDRGGPTLPEGLRSTALDSIADAWGVTRHSGLTRTWFELSERP